MRVRKKITNTYRTYYHTRLAHLHITSPLNIKLCGSWTRAQTWFWLFCATAIRFCCLALLRAAALRGDICCLLREGDAVLDSGDCTVVEEFV